MGCGHAIELFVDGAEQHLPPEALQGDGALLLFAKPREHRDLVEIRAGLVFGLDGEQAASHVDLVTEGKKAKASERFGEVQRRRQQTALHHGHSAARLNPEKLAREVNAILDTQALIEIDQVGATAQEDVLAVVDGDGAVLGVVQRIGRGAAAQERARF